MDVCDECGQRITNSYICSYCQGTFCKKHAHVDNHKCVKVIKGSYKKVKIKNTQDDSPTLSIEKPQSNYRQVLLLVIIISVGILASWNLSFSNGYSNGYFVGHELGEVQGTDIGYEIGYPEGHITGNLTGYEEGYEFGHENGIYLGQNEGYSEGYSVAHNIGFINGNQSAFETGMTQALLDLDGHVYNLSYPTLSQVKAFLRSDRTDREEYHLGSFKCSDYAQTVKTNAAKEGIHCYYVSLDFPEPPGHAIIAFNTTDKGLVFYEPQSDEKMDVSIGIRYWRDNIDRVRLDYDDTIIQYELIW